MDGLDYCIKRNHISVCLTRWLDELDLHTNIKGKPHNITSASLYCDVTGLDIVSNMVGWLSMFGSTDDELLIKNVR